MTTIRDVCKEALAKEIYEAQIEGALSGMNMLKATLQESEEKIKKHLTREQIYDIIDHIIEELK